MRALGFLLCLPALALGLFVGTRLGTTPAQAGSTNSVAAGDTNGGSAGDVEDVETTSGALLPSVTPSAPPHPSAVEPGEGGGREAVEVAEEAALDLADLGPVTDEELLAMLSEFLASGALEARYANDPHGLANFLFWQYLEADDPWLAWQVLQTHDLGDENFGAVGRELRDQGNLAAATQAWLEALRRDPTDGEWIGYLTEHDPNGALAILEEVILNDPGMEQNLRGSMVRMLLASGQTDEAMRRVDLMFNEEYVTPEAWDLLAQVNPEEAERRLRQEVGNDPHGEVRMRLARVLQSQGKSEELAELLEGVLTDVPGSWEALNMLSQVDSEASLAILQRRVAAGNDEAHVLGMMGDQLNQLGRTGEAVDAWMQAFEQDPQNTTWSYRLLQHSPDQFFPLYEQRTQEINYDEMWGDLADAYWSAGRHADAQRAWETARSLDPDDGEWTGKLSSLASGEDPLGGYNVIDGWSGYSGLGYYGYSEVIHEPFTYDLGGGW